MPAAQPQPDIADVLDKAGDALLRLIADMRLGTPFGRADVRHAEHEERAQAIARAIIAPFRGKGARPVHPPSWVSADGRSAGW